MKKFEVTELMKELGTDPGPLGAATAAAMKNLGIDPKKYSSIDSKIRWAAKNKQLVKKMLDSERAEEK